MRELLRRGRDSSRMGCSFRRGSELDLVKRIRGKHEIPSEKATLRYVPDSRFHVSRFFLLCSFVPDHCWYEVKDERACIEVCDTGRATNKH